MCHSCICCRYQRQRRDRNRYSSFYLEIKYSNSTADDDADEDYDVIVKSSHSRVTRRGSVFFSTEGKKEKNKKKGVAGKEALF